MQVYTSHILDDSGIYIAALIINWDDVSNIDFTLDLVKLEIAQSTDDDCSQIEVWEGKTTNIKGTP